METQIIDNYRSMTNRNGIAMIIVSDLESAFEPKHVDLTQSGLNLSNDHQRIILRNLDANLLNALKTTKKVFLALTDIELQEFNFEKTITA